RRSGSHSGSVAALCEWTDYQLSYYLPARADDPLRTDRRDRPCPGDEAGRDAWNVRPAWTGRSAVTNPFEDPNGRYFVLINDEGQYSLWPAFVKVPDGWTVVHGEDGRQ